MYEVVKRGQTMERIKEVRVVECWTPNSVGKIKCETFVGQEEYFSTILSYTFLVSANEPLCNRNGSREHKPRPIIRWVTTLFL